MNQQQLSFRVIVERDENRWRAYCPELEVHGAATWGRTKQDARQHIREVLDMIVAEGRDGPSEP